MTKNRPGQMISTFVGLTKIRAFAGKCGQTCANLLMKGLDTVAVVTIYGGRPRIRAFLLKCG